MTKSIKQLRARKVLKINNIPHLADEIGKIISATQTKSCSLDPLQTHILKEFLPELLPFIVDMCNMSIEKGCLPTHQCNAIITPCLKKAGANQSDVKNYRLFLTFQ